MDRDYILAIKQLAQNCQYHTVEIDPDDLIALCDLALRALREG